MVVYDGAHLGVGTVVCDQGGLELHLVDEFAVLLGVLEDGLIPEELLDLLEGEVGEVGVVVMDLQDICHELPANVSWGLYDMPQPIDAINAYNPDFLGAHLTSEGFGLV